MKRQIVALVTRLGLKCQVINHDSEGIRVRHVVLDMYMSICHASSVKDTRLIALIETKQMKALKTVAKRQKVSLAEVVRRAINEYLARKR
jgi:Ribbon-helix-helix protein, copG family